MKTKSLPPFKSSLLNAMALAVLVVPLATIPTKGKPPGNGGGGGKEATDAEIAELGGPDSTGVPGAALLPEITIRRTDSGLLVSWDVEGYELESADELDAAAWELVEAVVDNGVTLRIEAGHRFYRLRSISQ